MSQIENTQCNFQKQKLVWRALIRLIQFYRSTILCIIDIKKATKNNVESASASGRSRILAQFISNADLRMPIVAVGRGLSHE